MERFCRQTFCRLAASDQMMEDDQVVDAYLKVLHKSHDANALSVLSALASALCFVGRSRHRYGSLRPTFPSFHRRFSASSRMRVLCQIMQGCMSCRG
jgi:hypothetical protein